MTIDSSDGARFADASHTYRILSTYQAVSARQVRVALDHFFSDVQLVTDTMNEFDPEKVKLRREQAAQTAVEAQGNQVEVGAT